MSLRSIFITCAAMFILSNSACAQDESTEIVTIENTIHTMFEGMRLGDSAMVSQVFYPDAQFFSAFKTKDGVHKLEEGSVQDWLNAIGTPHDQMWNEESWDIAIKIDGNLAHAWAPYAFYIDDTFSHCGVNSFHLTMDEDGAWKIFHGTDTRRRGDCDSYIPAEIKAKHSSKD